MDKVASIIGFALKARKAVIGIDAAERCKKRIYLFVLCDTAADNTKAALKRLAAQKHAEIMLAGPTPLGESISMTGVKIIGIIDGQMAKAMKKYAGENFKVCSEVK